MQVICFPKSRYQIQIFYRTETTVCGKDEEDYQGLDNRGRIAVVSMMERPDWILGRN